MTKIEAKDVLVGDKIRTTTIYKDGSEVVVTGVVAWKRGAKSMYTKDDVCLASENYYTDAETSIELVERIEPKDHVVVMILEDGTEDLATLGLWAKKDAEEKQASLQKHYDTYTIGKYKGSKYEVRKVVSI